MSVISSSLSGWNPSPLAWHKRPFMILPLFKLQSHFTICPHMFSAFQPDWPAVSPKAPALSRLDALEHTTSSYNLYLLIFFFLTWKISPHLESLISGLSPSNTPHLSEVLFPQSPSDIWYIYIYKIDYFTHLFPSLHFEKGCISHLSIPSTH